jgi:drug/metabolite transporter (DMT)-like permease
VPDTRRNLVLFAVLAALWGASYMFIKVGLEDLSAPMIVFLRTALAALMMLPFALATGALAPLRGRGRKIAFLALLQVALPFMLITVGEHWVSSALAGILVASAPIFNTLFAPRLDHSEGVHGRALAGVALGMAGVVLLFGVDVSGDWREVVGALMIVLAAVGYALAGFYFKRNFAGDDPVAVAGLTMATTAGYLLIPALVTAPSAFPSLDATLSVLALGIGGTGIAFVIFYMLMRDMGVTRTSLVAYVAPAFAVGYGALVLDEHITVATIAGLALILGGSWLAARKRPAHADADAEPAPVAEGPVAQVA